MATQAGIGVLIGLGIGSGVTAFLMQRIIRRQDNALQQSLNRLNRMQEDHAQDLNAALEKMAADYEQQLAAKIERYQDTHGQQLRELEAEYEARMAVFAGINNFPENTDTAVATPPTIEPSEAATESTQPVNPFTPIPDPWMEAGNEPASPEPDVVDVAPAGSSPSAAPPSATSKSAKAAPATSASSARSELTQTAAKLGQAAGINRKDALRAVPQLGKLLKDSDADVRLAAVMALQESGSIKAIPFLRQALRDSDSRIVAAASAALSRFKGSKKPAPKAKSQKKKPRR
ncbi:pbs lyase heat domain protein repeat-containing protein [Leptolyngbya sp. Heron Island J]|uniref:HEAT repeat domain-containing protein n=1 Tax=Leptolyngbya sp. Heron Island J TaxID=1385935 RepID=UPI0003B99A4C|nr:HEAT repeat domain-containing protein [Leptolyngbya sp. Heron Island J]ESA35072.1 pbs lyase heat domain protein repeat-containing protein [Leptolyngbya sp. Heron Island J]